MRLPVESFIVLVAVVNLYPELFALLLSLEGVSLSSVLWMLGDFIGFVRYFVLTDSVCVFIALGFVVGVDF